jgi:hypothetical protein
VQDNRANQRRAEVSERTNFASKHDLQVIKIAKSARTNEKVMSNVCIKNTSNYKGYKPMTTEGEK